MSTDKRTVKWYNEHAGDYTKHVRNPRESIYHSLYEKPAIYAELPDLAGKDVISLGCGSGEDSNYLKHKGAKRSLGIDISEKLLEEARAAYPACEFALMDMEKLQLPDESFDFAYSSYAIHYIEDWSKVFCEVYRVLKPGTNFLFSCGHPVSSAMVETVNTEEEKVRQLGFITNKKAKTVRVIGDYLKRRKITSIGEGFDVTTYHKSLSEITNEATKAGFLVQALLEPMPLKEMEGVSKVDYIKLSKVPYVVIYKLLKLKL